MKKLVYFLVLAVSFAAVILVAIFGTRPQGIVECIYIDTIKIKPSDESVYQEESDTESAKMILVYDKNEELEYDGSFYMPYIFKTEISPLDVTNRSFSYYIDDVSKSYMDFPPQSENASKNGAFLIKRVTNKQFIVVDVHCRALDGGKAKIDTLRVIIDYRSVYYEE